MREGWGLAKMEAERGGWGFSEETWGSVLRMWEKTKRARGNLGQEEKSVGGQGDIQATLPLVGRVRINPPLPLFWRLTDAWIPGSDFPPAGRSPFSPPVSLP